MAKKRANQKDLDDQFEAFLKASLSDEESLTSARIQKYLEPKKKGNKPWWMEDEDEGEEKTGTGKSFLKPKKAKTPLPEKDESQKFKKPTTGTSTSGFDVSMSRDSLEDVPPKDLKFGEKAKREILPEASLEDSYTYTDTTGTAGAGNITIPPGMDTLDEAADKERFFKDLEKGASSTLDYEKLNKDLGTSGTMGALGTLESEPASTGKGWEKYQQESGEYSDEFEEEEKEVPTKTDDEKAQQKPSMLAKVSDSLLESTESTFGTGKFKDDKVHSTINEEEDHSEEEEEEREETKIPSPRTGTGFINTNTSQDLAALRKALHVAGMETGGTAAKDSLGQDIGKSIDTSVTRHDSDTTEETHKFGMGTLPQRETDKPSRTVEDILREVDEIERRAKEVEPQKEGGGIFDLLQPVAAARTDSYDDQDSGRGFALSPIQSVQDQDHGLSLSPVQQTHHEEGNVFDLLQPAQPASFFPDEDLPTVTKTPPRPAKRKSKYSNVQSSGYGQKVTPKSSKTQLDTQTGWSPKSAMKQKIRGTETITTQSRQKGAMKEQQLVASVESFAQYIKDHFSAKDGKGISLEAPFSEEEPILSNSQRMERLSLLGREKILQQEVKDWQDQWKEERKMNTKVKADLVAQERVYLRQIEALKLEHEQELFKLKQENFVLGAKVTESDVQKDTKRHVLEGGSLDNVSKEQLQLMEREIREQERLISGYQQENERLYKELKAGQITSKMTEERMFKENQKQAAEITSLREQLHRREVELKNKGVITSPLAQRQIVAGSPASAILGAGRIAQLGAELKQAQIKIEEVEKENRTLEQAQRELEQHIEILVRDREKNEDKIRYAKEMKTQETHQMQQNYEQEIERLHRKLKWYAENQELLDRDAEVIREKNEEIRHLKHRLEEMSSETSQKQQESRNRIKERAADARRIQDLERQVKEMEGILRKRHPNSIPALMLAAAAIPDPMAQKTPTVQFLEKRVKKLEEELDSTAEEGKRDLRVMEQKYNAIKIQYEERIADLEGQLERIRGPDPQELREHPHTHTVALHRELDSVKERYKKKVSELEGEVEKWRKEVGTLKAKEIAAAKAESKAVKDTESELQMRVKSMTVELCNKDKEIEILRKMVDTLEKENKKMEMDSIRHGMGRGKVSSKTKVKGRGKQITPRDDITLEPTVPAYREPQKQYEPQTFSGLHISDVIKENEELKEKLGHLEFQLDHQRVDLHKAVAEAEAAARRAREEAAEQLSSVKRTHEAEIQRLLTEHAMSHSVSKVAELQSKCDTQEVMIKHLKEQQTMSAIDREQLSAARIREAALEEQVKKLLEDLREAKKSHTPEMRHFEALHDKIVQMENRHQTRERELQQIINQTKFRAGLEMDQEVEKWRRMVDAKNLETERFRQELDSILEVLRLLQRQGIVLPMNSVPGYR